jgi:hypothetical protein
MLYRAAAAAAAHTLEQPLKMDQERLQGRVVIALGALQALAETLVKLVETAEL